MFGKKMFMGSPAFNPVVEALRRRLDEDDDAPGNMTLEEIMMLYHNRACRRISPGSIEAKKFQRGSVLIKKDEVILVLEAGDNTTEFPHHSIRYCGPRTKMYTGVLPGSKMYTSGGVLVLMEVGSEVRKIRQVVREFADRRNTLIIPIGPRKYNPTALCGSIDLRCREFAGLSGYKDAIRSGSRSRVT